MVGIGKHKRTGAGDPMSVARITGLFAISAAIIGAIPTSISLLSHETSHETIHEASQETVVSKPPPPTTATPAPTAASLPNGPRDSALRFSPLKNGKLTVSGSASNDVIGMYVMIGPKPAGGYDTGCGNVVNQQWQAEVPTDASWPNYPLQTVPAYVGSCVAARSASAVKFIFQGTEPTTPPPPPPDQILDCAKQNGPSCFDSPGFGPPTTYQPKQ